MYVKWKEDKEEALEAKAVYYRTMFSVKCICETKTVKISKNDPLIAIVTKSHVAAKK